MPDGVIKWTEVFEPPTPPIGRVYTWLDSISGTMKQKDGAGVVNDFEGAQGAQGDQGIPGDAGPAGPAGPAFVIDYEFSETLKENDTTVFVSYIQKNVTIPAAGDYEIMCSWQWSGNSNQEDCEVNLVVDGTTYAMQIEEPKDSAGAGPSGTNQRIARAQNIIHNFASSGSKSIDMQLRSSGKL